MALDREFWRRFRDRIKQILIPLLERGAQQGAENAGEEIERLGIGISFDLVNQEVLQWVREEYSPDLIKGITDTTREGVKQAIDSWIESGEPLPALVDKLVPTFGPKRAELVSSTEITRVYAKGNTLAWRESGIVKARKWMTARDEIVRQCPICWPLDGKIFDIETDKIEHPDKEIFDSIGSIDGPPAHPRCRCFWVPVVINQ